MIVSLKARIILIPSPCPRRGRGRGRDMQRECAHAAFEHKEPLARVVKMILATPRETSGSQFFRRSLISAIENSSRFELRAVCPGRDVQALAPRFGVGQAVAAPAS